MYVKNGIYYADPGNYLSSGSIVGFSVRSNTPSEHQLTISDAHIEGRYIKFNNNLFSIKYNPNWTYADYKKHIIKWRYSLDDQIAIMLNKDDSTDDQIAYDRMMQWRLFAAELSRLIMSL